MRVTSINNYKELNSEKLVKSLNIGDIISGRVADTSAGRMTLNISSGQTINAAVMIDKPIEKGSIVEIVITHMVDDNIYAQLLKPKSVEKTARNEIVNILKELGASITEFNENVVKTLIKYKQPINKEIIDYLNYLNKTAELFKENDIKTVLNLIFSEKHILNTQLHELSDLSSTFDISKALDIKSLQTGFSIEKNSEEIIGRYIEAVLNNCDYDEKTLKQVEQIFYEAMKVNNAVKKADIETLVFMLSKNIKITPENLTIYDEINNKSRILSRFTENLLETIKDYGDAEIQLIKDRLKGIFLQFDDFNKDAVNTKTKEFLSLLAQLESALNNKENNSYESRYYIMSLRNTLDFIKSINNTMNYLQIPIILNNEKTDIEIFVYEKGKRNKKLDISNVNILICLNTSNLGYIESHIAVSNKNVNIVFKSSDNKVSKIISVHCENLKEALKLKGYNISISSIENKDKKMNLSSMEEVLNPECISRYSLDVRI